MQTRPWTTAQPATRPVVGVCGVPSVATWGFWSQPAVLVAETYLAAIRDAGGLPIIVPPEDDESEVMRILAMVDGLVLSGGTDVSPDLYGQAASARMEETVRGRDEFELHIAAHAVKADLPVLGICRGLQILNVATGGTLHQHLADGAFAEHRPAPGRLDAATRHGVEVERDSLLGELGLAGLREVNSHHHQGVAEVGYGGRVVARSVPDGAVEAVEWTGARFALGVQWHPEEPRMSELFDGLVRAAAGATDFQRRKR